MAWPYRNEHVGATRQAFQELRNNLNCERTLSDEDTASS